MSPATSRRRLLTLAGASALAGLAGCSALVDRDERETFERSYDAADLASLSLSVSVGDVVVRPADREDVLVRGEKRAASEDAIDALRLRERRDGEELSLERVVEDEPWPIGFWATPELNLDVEVPRSLRVAAVETSTGELDVEGVAGPTRLDASTGAVRAVGVDGPVSAAVSTGSVTVDGTIDDLETSTGQVDATVRALAADARIETSTGDVTVALAPDLALRVTVETSTGDVDPPADGFEVRSSDADLDVERGEGGPRLRIETSTGDVTVRSVG